MLFVCVFALSVSAAHELKEQTTNAYGDLSFFDETITVGRTNTKNGFKPYFDENGTTYARVVMGDGTTFYTFPTSYVLSETTIYGTSGHNLYVPDFSSLNSAMQTATGTNPNWTKANVYRIELPYTVNRLNAGSQNFASYTNVVEITLQPNSTMQDKNSTMVFWKCENLETINNLETFTFREGCLGGSFQNCYKLTSLTIGYSPEVTKTGDNTFSGCSNLVSVNFNTAFPNIVDIGGSGVFQNCTSLTTLDLSSMASLKSIGKFCFSGCTALKTIISSGINQVGAVIIPEGVTSLGQEIFYNCDSIKYLSLPSTITYLGPSIIRDSSGLEFVDFNENKNAINLDNWGHFHSCTSLKAVSLPDGIEIINNRFMTSCSSMKAVYLPANLKQMNTNGNGQGPFCYSTKMYFVQEPFEVRDENGYFLGESFVMPEKPEMYFMPENLSAAGGNASSGTWFRECASLNNIIIMPEAFTESTVAQMFRGIASSSQRKSVVYLGKITNYCWSEMNKYIDFVFANPENTDISGINFTAFYNRNNEYCYFYFCSTGYRYTMAAADAASVAATKVENSYCHIANPDKTKTTDETCLTNRIINTYCFCGVGIDVDKEVENTALGHNHDLENGASLLDIVYSDLTKAGYKHIKCERCDVTDDSVATLPIIYFLGYSTDSKTCASLTVGFRIDKDAIADYESGTGNKITLGVFGVITEKLTHSDGVYTPFEAQENGIPVIVANAPDNVYAFNLVINGFTSDEYRALPISMGAYATINGETVYIQDTQVEAVGSYTVNECIADITPPETTIPGDDE